MQTRGAEKVWGSRDGGGDGREERQTDRQAVTQRQTKMETDADRQTQTERHRVRWTDTAVDRQTGRQAVTQRQTKMETDADRETQSESDTDKIRLTTEADRQTDRQADRRESRESLPAPGCLPCKSRLHPTLRVLGAPCVLIRTWHLQFGQLKSVFLPVVRGSRGLTSPDPRRSCPSPNPPHLPGPCYQPALGLAPAALG